MQDEAVEGTVIPFGKSGLADVVYRFGEMFREHMNAYQETIKELKERIEDLEGHAEHGPGTTCGVCCPPDDCPETVGADVYAEIISSDFEGECANANCGLPILPGDEIIRVDEEKWVHDDCVR